MTHSTFSLFIIASTAAVVFRPLGSPRLSRQFTSLTQFSGSDMSLDEYACSIGTPLVNRRTPPKAAKQGFPSPIRAYNDKRCPAFPDRIFIGTKLDNLNADVLAYDSISTGEIGKSDHDLVYQVIQFPMYVFFPNILSHTNSYDSA